MHLIWGTLLDSQIIIFKLILICNRNVFVFIKYLKKLLKLQTSLLPVLPDSQLMGALTAAQKQLNWTVTQWRGEQFVGTEMKQGGAVAVGVRHDQRY